MSPDINADNPMNSQTHSLIVYRNESFMLAGDDSTFELAPNLY